MTRHSPHIEGAFRYVLPIETRFRDTDAMGHINNAVYLTYFEAARAGYYTAVTGRSFEGIADDPVSIILARATVDFRAQAWYGERLLVACRTTWAGHSSFAFGYRVTADVDSTRGPGRLVAEGETIQVMFDYATQRPTRIPAELLAQIADYEGGPIHTDPDAHVSRVGSFVRATKSPLREALRGPYNRADRRRGDLPRLSGEGAMGLASGMLRDLPSCGASVTVDARFAPACGSAMPGSSDGGTRRMVTFLCSEVTGSAVLDPEDISP